MSKETIEQHIEKKNKASEIQEGKAQWFRMVMILIFALIVMITTSLLGVLAAHAFMWFIQ